MQNLRVLLTGSSPFGGLAKSAAHDVVQVLAAGPAGECMTLVPVIVPAVRAGLSELVASLIDRHRPDVVLGLGIEPGISAIRVEQRALNLVDSPIPDNAGELLTRRIPFPGEPSELLGTAAAALMAQRMQEAGIAAEVSHFAGTHLCNLTYYSALRQLAHHGRRVPCAYMHLALLPEQESAIWPASMTFDLQLHAVRMALEAMALQARTAFADH